MHVVKKRVSDCGDLLKSIFIILHFSSTLVLLIIHSKNGKSGESYDPHVAPSLDTAAGCRWVITNDMYINKHIENVIFVMCERSLVTPYLRTGTFDLSRKGE